MKCAFSYSIFGLRTIEGQYVSSSMDESIRLGQTPKVFFKQHWLDWWLLFIEPRISESTPPKRRFWKGLQKMKCAVSRYFSAGVSTRLGIRTIEKSIEDQHLIFCSVFQNLRLGTMWETTFARNTQAGFCKEVYESNILFSIGYGRKVLTKSGLGISRKCCFPHGLGTIKFMPPKRRFWRELQKMKCMFQRLFSRV